MQALLYNKVFVNSVIAVIIFGITQLIKCTLIKPHTKKIVNEKIRKAVNTVIYFIPYGLGIVFELIYSSWIQEEFDVIMGIVHGASGIACYGLFERIYSIITGEKIKLDNPYEKEEEAIAAKNLMDSISEDGKIDEEDRDAIDEFWDMIKNKK